LSKNNKNAEGDLPEPVQDQELMESSDIKNLSRHPARAESNYREDTLVVMARESKHTLNMFTEQRMINHIHSPLDHKAPIRKTVSSSSRQLQNFNALFGRQ